MEENKRIPMEEWKAQKRAERQKLFDGQKAELERVVFSGKALADYMVGRGRLGSHLSAGNAALVLAQSPNAQAVKSMQEWNSMGRSINRGAQGISVLARKNNYWTAEWLFELSQTNGKEEYKPLRLAGCAVDLQNAVNAMVTLAPGEVVPIHNAEKPAFYDSNSQAIVLDMDSPEEEVFRWMPKALVQAYVNSVQGAECSRQVTDLYAECVSAELCGRFGLTPQEETATKLDKLLPAFEKGQERTMLEEISAFSRTIGDRVEQEFRPLQQTRSAKQPAQPSGRE